MAKQRKLPIDPIDLLSVPVFVGTMIWERRTLRRRAANPRPAHPRLTGLVPIGYERRDTEASLELLLGSVTVGLFTAGPLGRVQQRLFNRRFTSFGSRRGSFIAAMVLWDFLYYWDHRWMHEVRLFWAHHVTHHSSQRYNLSTALRQPWSPWLMAWVYWPMSLLGFPAARIFRAGQFNLLYQYWIHTESVDRMHPWAERILNTPSHHRVHHGVNPQYLDKNYGGVLILWDRWFGTFEPEVEPARYGLTKNVDTYNPFRLAYHEFAAIGRDVRSSSTWSNRLSHVVRGPGWTPALTEASSSPAPR